MAYDKLDRSRMRDVVHISPPHMGAVYSQYGRYYDAEGNRIRSIPGQPDDKVSSQGSQDVTCPTCGTVFNPTRPAAARMPGQHVPPPLPVAEGVPPEVLKRYADEEAAQAKADAEEEAAAAAEDEPENDDPSAPTEHTESGITPGDVDLGAWGRGEETYPFFSVREAIKQRLHVAGASTKAHALEILVEKGIVTRAQADATLSG